MPWIKVIDEKEARGELKKLYDEIIERRGKLSNIMKIHSLNPTAMKKHMDLYLTLMFEHSGVSREEREMIGVVVSNANGCRYCIKHHAEALSFYWRDNKKLQKFLRDFHSIKLSDRKRVMLEYIYKLTKPK